MAEEERLRQYIPTDTIIDVSRSQLGISTPSDKMSDDEIAHVMRFLGASAPDTVWDGDDFKFGPLGLALVLSLTLYEFPDFYERYELWQTN